MENADQLYGFAAECAIKKALSSLPAFAKNGCLHKGYKDHIDLLWNKAGHQSLQKAVPHLSMLLRCANPFADWHVDQRYGGDGTVSREALNIHRDFTKRLLGAVGLNGIRK